MMNLVNKAKDVLFKPAEFFKKVSTEKGIKDALIFFAIVWLISMILSALIASMALGALGTAFSIATLPMQYVMGFVGLLIATVFLFIFTKILGGTGNFEQTLRVGCYVAVTGLVSWIPIIGFVGMIWGIVLTVIGIQEIHQLTLLKAIIAVVVIPLAIVVVLGIFFMSLFATMFGSFFGGFFSALTG